MLCIKYCYSYYSQNCKKYYMAYKYLKSCQVCIQSSTGIFCWNQGMIHLNRNLCKHQHCYMQYSVCHKVYKFLAQDKTQLNIRCIHYCLHSFCSLGLNYRIYNVRYPDKILCCIRYIYNLRSYYSLHQLYYKKNNLTFRCQANNQSYIGIFCLNQ
jgi:hypothetical protein